MITRRKIGQSRKTTTIIVAILFFRLPFGDYFLNSLNLFSQKCVEIVKRKWILVTLGGKRFETNRDWCSDKFTMIALRTSSEAQGQQVGTIESSRPQYSSQIVETDTVSLEFSGKFLRFLLLTLLFSL